MSSKIPASAFEKGQASARDDGDRGVNPFAEGSVEHNNFEVGRKFGLQRLRVTAAFAPPLAAAKS